ncbi:alpha-glucosidase [Nocardioides albertanoniae]|uniref:Alpha-glucosidase n=1 Tax=Nocardioides albertanoniae TaxID=1175486 RepID=A0A543AE21_9ACTN|nr:glycoside hydrolase family 13 protein [Nocardioides albertanoniae]TQL70831.1 alpha-glucosidase [Nocardioides albertanoniae]
MSGTEWWRTAVVYQVYLRSFADGNGDGIGDIAGLRDRLPYLRDLGVDAIWINPWYRSPQADAGYDVADYREIEPAYGTLGEAEAMLSEAHAAGLRVLLDIVPNHTSSEHPWFRAALAGDEDARRRYVIRPGRGHHGEEPPNNWQSLFGGPAWTRMPSRPGAETTEWYLHLFAPEQPDLAWDDADVVADFEDVLAFWFDRGVDGFRIDVAHGLAKHPDLPDGGDFPPGDYRHPAWDQEAVHPIYRGWRAVADRYPDRVFVAEAWVADNERLARYLRPDELHTAFQFDFLHAPFRADVLRPTIESALSAAAAVGAPSTWVLSNHDVVRHVTRFARHQPDHAVASTWEQERWLAEAADLEVGTRRARAAALVTLGLPGTAYLYQGEELGLPEVEDIPDADRRDPIWSQSGGTRPGRDGCRIPLPWSGVTPPYGFSPPGTTDRTWLPMPKDWDALTVEAQQGEPDSMLELHRRAIALRRHRLTGSASFAWLPAPEGVLAFARGPVQVWLNTSADPVDLPAGAEEMLRSSGTAGRLGPDEAVWLRPGSDGES